MVQNKYRYIYGPVSSWRLGSSLGIDLVSNEKKICTFDCVYCQVGKIDIFKDRREVFVPTEKIVEEIKALPPLKIDYITFSGRGEPTLAKNLGEVIKKVKKLRREKAAIITNSSLIDMADVQEDLRLADLVMLKLDAPSEELFLKINRPMQAVKFDKILEGIKRFKSIYKGRFVLQIMFIEENKECARDLAELAREINPDEIQLNTPLRPCKVKPLPREEMTAIECYFKGMNFVSVYGAKG